MTPLHQNTKNVRILENMDIDHTVIDPFEVSDGYRRP